LAITCISIAILANSQESRFFEHDGDQREYILYKPDGLVADAPLVFVLHGYSSNAQSVMDRYGMNAVADEKGFAVCYPQGAKDILSIAHWNANLSISNVDDIGFLSELAIFLQQTENLNSDNTFMCGMSNGGFMSYTMACERPDIFHAIASVTGTMSGYDWQNCDPENPIPVLQIAGTDDIVVPIDGSMSTIGGWGGAPGLDSVMAFWVRENACNMLETEIINADNSTTVKKYTNGIDDHEVHRYLIEDWGHEWPGPGASTGYSASEVIWEFFEKWIEGTTSASEPIAGMNQLRVYPNPASSEITIERLQSRTGMLQIVNTMGQLVWSRSVNGSQARIDISNLADGMYVIVTDGVTGRFIKQ